MNNLVIVTHRETGEQKTYSGDYRIVSTSRRFVVIREPLYVAVFSGDRSEYFFDIESLDDDD